MVPAGPPVCVTGGMPHMQQVTHHRPGAFLLYGVLANHPPTPAPSLCPLRSAVRLHSGHDLYTEPSMPTMSGTATGLPASLDPLPYLPPLREAICSFKYRSKHTLARPLARLMISALPRGIEADVIIPVPLHPARLRAREFNQSLLLADQLSRHLARPVSAEKPRQGCRHRSSNHTHATGTVTKSAKCI